MSLESGQMLLHYRMVEQIGQGGMGIVWKAVDTTLDRQVAIKILPEEFAADATRRARFQREAKILASLNHPEIASIYSLHETAGLRFLAMELVDGEVLTQRIPAQHHPSRPQAGQCDGHPGSAGLAPGPEPVDSTGGMIRPVIW